MKEHGCFSNRGEKLNDAHQPGSSCHPSANGLWMCAVFHSARFTPQTFVWSTIGTVNHDELVSIGKYIFEPSLFCRGFSSSFMFLRPAFALLKATLEVDIKAVSSNLSFPFRIRYKCVFFFFFFHENRLKWFWFSYVNIYTGKLKR